MLSFTIFTPRLRANLSKIFIALRAVHTPSTIPVSLASLKVLQDNASSLSHLSFMVLTETKNLFSNFRAIRDFYEVVNIPNKIVDGSESYPGDSHERGMGTSVEFKYVIRIHDILLCE